MASELEGVGDGQGAREVVAEAIVGAGVEEEKTWVPWVEP